MAAGPLAAEPRSLIDPGEAHARRALRSLDARASSSPRSAAIQLQRIRRGIERPGQGIDYLPEGARLNRELDRIERGIVRGARAPTPRAGERAPAAGGQGLPRSYGEADGLPRSYGQGDGLPRSYDAAAGGTAPGSSGNNLVTVARLLNRAELALERGRDRQARSDLATARSFLDDVAEAEPVAVRRGALAERLATLQDRVAAAAERD